MRDADRKTLPVLMGARPAAVIRMRGWERYVYVGFCIAMTVTGTLSFGTLVGVSVSAGVLNTADTVTGFVGVVAVIAFVLAMLRYDGEVQGAPCCRSHRPSSQPASADSSSEKHGRRATTTPTSR